MAISFQNVGQSPDKTPGQMPLKRQGQNLTRTKFPYYTGYAARRSVCLSACLSVCLSACVCLSVCLSVCPPARLS